MQIKIIILVSLLFSTSFSQKMTKQTEFYRLINKISLQSDDVITISGVGDMMLGTNYPKKSHLPKDSGKTVLKSVHTYLKAADLTFGNLEGVLLTDSGKVKRCGNPKFCYAFKSPDHFVNHFKNAGFDVLSIANNHINDFGEIGRKNTVRLLDSVQIEYAGLLQYPYTVFKRNGITYGFTAFAPNTGTVPLNDHKNAKSIVSKLDSLSDIVIVSFHGGAEGRKYRNITKKTEKYVGENRGNPYKFARDVIDAGADIVFGHGPHVTRAIDLYKNRFIAYSLGNFATYDRFNLKGPAGIAPIMNVLTNQRGEFLLAEIIPIKQIRRGIPVYDDKKNVIKEIQTLTKKDLPDVELTIFNNGIVKKKIKPTSTDANSASE